MTNIANIQDKVLFFGLPKCGLVSTDNFWDINNFKKNIVINLTKTNIKEYRCLFPKHIFVTIVRNPWHRIVSMYFYWKRIRSFNNFFKIIMNLDEVPTFTEFVRLLPYMKKFLGWGLSTYFNSLDAKAEDFDIVIKLEEIDEQFKQVQNILEAKIPLTQHNKGDYEGSYQQYYTDETRELIAEYFKYEIDTFGYTF
jgi:hypothetical protein